MNAGITGHQKAARVPRAALQPGIRAAVRSEGVAPESRHAGGGLAAIGLMAGVLANTGSEA